MNRRKVCNWNSEPLCRHLWVIFILMLNEEEHHIWSWQLIQNSNLRGSFTVRLHTPALAAKDSGWLRSIQSGICSVFTCLQPKCESKHSKWLNMVFHGFTKIFWDIFPVQQTFYTLGGLKACLWYGSLSCHVGYQGSCGAAAAGSWGPAGDGVFNTVTNANTHAHKNPHHT